MSAKFRIIIFATILPVISLIYGMFSKQYDISLNSLYTVICIVGFTTINKKIPVLKTETFCAVIAFILLSVFAGKALKMYNLIPHWDKILHFLSGFILAPVGKQLYITFNTNNKNIKLMNLFAIIFAIASAAVWEIYEFSIDKIFGTVSQNGSLDDTMWDMILGTVSSILSIIICNKKTNQY